MQSRFCTAVVRSALLYDSETWPCMEDCQCLSTRVFVVLLELCWKISLTNVRLCSVGMGIWNPKQSKQELAVGPLADQFDLLKPIVLSQVK